MKTHIAMMIALVTLVPGLARAQAQPAGGAGWAEGGITAGDLLRVTVLREPLLSFEQTVPADGIIDFHRLGRKDVRGLSGEALRGQLVQEYARYLVDPTIRVDVMRKVQILGAVREPKVYLLHPTMTIADAIAMAGGHLPEGRTDRVELRREGQTIEVLLLASDNNMLADSPVRSGDQLFIPERPFVSRNAATLTTAVTGALALLIALLVR
jgi:protein involved in polysaccharide export with SLBB domain